MLKISIITVCYNSESTIEETFKSVKSQVYSNLEYIVIDGSSTDGTMGIVNKYSDVISKVISESDKGLYDAMNKGIKIATGDIIGILNSDDVFFDENVLEKVANFHNVNDIDASIGNIVQINDRKKIIRNYSSKYWSPNKLKLGFMPPHPSIFFKKELFEKLGFYDLSFKSGADYELIVRYFLKNKITYKYSSITTTSMAIGGISSSGFSSYKMITKEICKALEMNKVSFVAYKVKYRMVWKIWSFLRK
ncbi:glycosyltransferase family 2 protein [Tenacibaculum sp. 190524A05c]|uniref:glycosyltransferase family 2 protein n=1 Tax=Tenacibaculum platacis TaxID=3137852 RepID=UPI0031FB37C6